MEALGPEGLENIRVSRSGMRAGLHRLNDGFQAQFEAQYASKQSLIEVEGSALRKRIEHQEDEMVKLHDTIGDQAASIDNLNVSDSVDRSSPDTDPLYVQRLLAEATSGVEGGREFAQAVQELERTKRTSELQQAEFESVKRNLMRDVTDRCEKVSFSLQSAEQGSGPYWLSCTGR
jgi:kinesin family protein 5